MSPVTNTHVVSGVPEVKEDSVSKILERRGIKYSHRNDDILVPNTIEEQQMKKARKVRGLGVRTYTISSHSFKTGTTPTEKERQGTGYTHRTRVRLPVATEKTPPQTTAQPQNQVRGPEVRAMLCVMLIFPGNCRLGQRQVALIELGMIQSSDDLPTFAQSLYVCPF